MGSLRSQAWRRKRSLVALSVEQRARDRRDEAARAALRSIRPQAGASGTNFKATPLMQ
jgi:hypothetical protein